MYLQFIFRKEIAKKTRKTFLLNHFSDKIDRNAIAG